MKIVATVSKPEEAHLIRAHLEGSGIAAFVRDDNTVSVDWALSNAIGGVKVEVEDEDFDEARLVLSTFEKPEPEASSGKSLHGIGRYLVVFAFSVILIFGVISVRLGVANRHAINMALVASLVLGAFVSFLCAVLDM